MRALFICLLLFGCSNSSQLKKENLSVQNTSSAVAESETTQIKSTPLVQIEGGADVKGLSINIPNLPNDKLNSNMKKSADQSSFLDQSLKQVWESWSGMAYLILVVAAFLAWRLWNQIKSSKEGKFILGGIDLLTGALGSVNSKLDHADMSSSEWKSLAQIKDELQRKESELKAKL